MFFYFFVHCVSSVKSSLTYVDHDSRSETVPVPPVQLRNNGQSCSVVIAGRFAIFVVMVTKDALVVSMEHLSAEIWSPCSTTRVWHYITTIE